MDEKLNVITEKLYKDGVKKAEEEAKNILVEAKEKSKRIIEDANKQAKLILEKAKNETDETKRKVESELRLGGEQAVATIKQQIIGLLSEQVSSEISRSAFSDTEFIKKLIVTMLEKWKIEEGSLDINILLSEEIKEEMEIFFKTQQKDILDKGLEINFEKLDGKGFIIKSKNGSYQIEFTDEMFTAFFSDYLKGFTRKLLFEN